MALKKPSAIPVPDGASLPAPAASTPTPAPPSPGVSSAPVAASLAPTVPPAQARDLAALRERLAGGQNGGVNSPEGAEKLTPALLEPRTQEVDGVTQPIAQPAESSAAPAASDTAGTGLTRGQKAAATRAAKKAAASSATTTQEAGAPAPAVTGAATAAASSDPTLDRIVTALETIAHALEDKPEGFSLFERLVIAVENRGNR